MWASWPGFPRRNSPCVHDDLENHKNEEFHFSLILVEVSNLQVFIFEVQGPQNFSQLWGAKASGLSRI